VATTIHLAVAISDRATGIRTAVALGPAAAGVRVVSMGVRAVSIVRVRAVSIVRVRVVSIVRVRFPDRRATGALTFAAGKF